MSYTYYHNPRCSKSRQGLQLLADINITPKIVEYLKTGLNLQELQQIQRKLDIKPLNGMIRVKENIFKENNLREKKLSIDQWLEEIVKNPVLLERPILVSDTSAQIGRPIENLEKLF